LRLLAIAAAVLVGSAGVSLATTALVVEPGVIEACYGTKLGNLRKVEKDVPCAAGELRTAWNKQGPKGDPGDPFQGTFASPNGLYSISVTDLGIQLKGPSGSVDIDAATIELTNAGSNVTLTPAGAYVTGTVVQLNGCGAPVARIGDRAVVTAPNVSTIQTGSSTVCAG
jgi:hypothetical protein